MSEREKTERHGRSIRSTLIEPFAQLKLGIYVIVVCFIFLCFAGYLFHNSFTEQYKNVLSIFEIADPDMQWQVISNDIYLSNLKKLIFLFVIFVVVLFSVVFRMTHRCYGPLVSIERFAKSISKGKYFERVTIRKGDELTGLVMRLNGMAKELERKHGSLVDENGERRKRRQSDND